MIEDAQGHRLSGATAAAVTAYDQAVRAFNLVHGDAIGLFDTARQVAPDFAMAHLGKAWVFAVANDPVLMSQAKALPNVEETERYITSRLLVAGAERTDVFSPGAVDYIFRCSEGIPRQINNLCDNAMLSGYAAGESVIGRSIIEDVADTFDMLPKGDRGRQMGEEREAPARIFTAAGRAELWAAGAGA